METVLKVRLISYSQPHENELYVGQDVQELIAYCARVSNPSNQLNEDTSAKLLNYLAKHKHWSPFEMVSACLEIETTRDIARQILRHRSFSFQEFSQRYAVSEEFVTRETRLQDLKNRQNSIEIGEEIEARQTAEEWNMKQKKLINLVKENYEWALDKGIAKEQARAILPEGNTMSTLYMAGTLRSWIHYCELRRAHGTQKEHMLVADKCWNVLGTHFKDVVKAVESASE